MSNQATKYAEGDWGWKVKTPFSQAVEIGDQVFISEALTGQPS